MDEQKERGVRYETETVFTEEAVRGLFRAQFLLFEKLRIWSRVAMGAVLTAFGFSPVFGTPQRVLCIALGVWLLLGWNTVAKARADAVLKHTVGTCKLTEDEFNDRYSKAITGELTKKPFHLVMGW